MTDPDLQRALGRIVINGASLEFVLWLLMRTLEGAEDPATRTDPDYKPAYTPERSAKRARRLCRDSQLPAHLKERVFEWLRDVRAAQSQRNDFVHGHWIRDEPSDPGMHFLVDAGPRPPGQPPTPWQTWSIQAVNSAADGLKRLAQNGTSLLEDITSLGPAYQRSVQLGP
jgi:hypothetical protein